MCYREWTCQYEHLLERAKLPTLSERRKRAKLCHLFKIVHELTDCQVAPVYTKMLSYNTRQVSNLSLQDLRANTSQFLFSFYPHTISLWNSLPPDIQTTSSLHAFKQSLTSEWMLSSTPLYYNFIWLHACISTNAIHVNHWCILLSIRKYYRQKK